MEGDCVRESVYPSKRSKWDRKREWMPERGRKKEFKGKIDIVFSYDIEFKWDRKWLWQRKACGQEIVGDSVAQYQCHTIISEGSMYLVCVRDVK